jgi:hypothetical protein
LASTLGHLKSSVRLKRSGKGHGLIGMRWEVLESVGKKPGVLRSPAVLRT